MLNVNLDKCALHPIVCAEKVRSAGHGGAQRNNLHFFQWKQLKIHRNFAHKDKSNTSFGTVKGLLLSVCTHNINKGCGFIK